MKYVYTVYVRREICRACGPDAFKVQIENHLANLPSPFRPVLINSGLRGAEYVGLRGIRGSVDGALARASVRREREKKKEGREKGYWKTAVENIPSRRRRNRLRFSLHRAARAAFIHGFISRENFTFLHA